MGAHTPGETRYSPLKQIDTTNASRLGSAWIVRSRCRRRPQEATPLVLEWRRLWNHELERRFRRRCAHRQGEWRWDPEVNQAAFGRRSAAAS